MATGPVQKVALVSGAAGGIGRATALAFSKAHYNCVVSDVNVAGGEETVKMIAEQGNAEATFLKADVSKEDDVVALLKHTKEKYGRLDAAYNNAGIEGDEELTAETTLANWDRTLGINLTGTFLCCKHEIPLLLESGGGSIVNCSSVAGKIGHPHLPAYVASKHGVIGLTKSIAIDLATKGIRCNAVCPGVIDTGMIDRLKASKIDIEEMVKGMQPIGRMGTPDEVAAAVVWLSSNAASFVTGAALDVDGGWLAR